jgi:hypothetical protein
VPFLNEPLDLTDVKSERVHEMSAVWIDYDEKQIRLVGGELLVKPCAQHKSTRLSSGKRCRQCDSDCSFQGKSYGELLNYYRRIVQG